MSERKIKLKNGDGFLNAWIFFILALLAAVSVIRFNLHLTLLSVLSLCGIYSCLAAIFYKEGTTNQLSRLVCRGDEDCKKVLNAGRLNRYTSVADLGLVYFAGQFVFLLFANIARWESKTTYLIYIQVIIAVSSAIVSIIYQGLIAKAWCKICLITVCIIVLQALSFTYFFVGNGPAFDRFTLTLDAASLFLASFAIASVWFVLKPLIIKGKWTDQYMFIINSWKRSPSIFLSILQQGRRIPITKNEYDIIVGDPTAPTQILAILHPYCTHCRETYRRLVSMAANSPEKVYVVIRFKLKISHVSPEQSKMAVTRILQTYFNSDFSNHRNDAIVEEWYDLMSIHAFEDRFGINDQTKKYYVDLEKIEKWNTDQHIQLSPTLFINGTELPETLTLSDLEQIVPKLPIERRVINFKQPKL